MSIGPQKRPKGSLPVPASLLEEGVRQRLALTQLLFSHSETGRQKKQAQKFQGHRVGECESSGGGWRGGQVGGSEEAS